MLGWGGVLGWGVGVGWGGGGGGGVGGCSSVVRGSEFKFEDPGFDSLTGQAAYRCMYMYVNSSFHSFISLV